MASFGTKLVDKDRTPISMQVKNENTELGDAGAGKKVTNCTLCVLLPGVMESIPLNVILSEATSVTFTNTSKSNTVYLTGYMTAEDAFGGYEGSSEEEFDEQDSEEDEDEEEEEEQKVSLNKQGNKVQKQGDVAKSSKPTPTVPQKTQGKQKDEESDEEDISMEEDLSDDFLGDESDEEESEEEDDNMKALFANQKSKDGQKKNEPNVPKQPPNKKPNTPQMTPQSQKKQNNVSQNNQQTANAGNQSSGDKLTPSQKKRLRKKRKKMEQKAQGSS